MLLDTYTTPEALKMLDYFGWPEDFEKCFCTPSWSCGAFVTRGLEYVHTFTQNHALAILQAHLWKIIGERYDYVHECKDNKEAIVIHYVHEDGHKLAVRFTCEDNEDLDTLLVNTCTWIMEKENGS